MARSRKRLLRKRRIAPGISKAFPGSSPGHLQHSPMHQPTRISVMAYGPEGFVEHTDINDLRQIEPLMRTWPVVWVGVNGLANIEALEQLGEMFSLDRLLLEDVLDVGHRPKIELYEHNIFTVVKAATLADQFDSEQVSMFVKKNVVIVFQEKSSQRFEQVRARVRRGTGKIRHNGPDYLFYALLDEIIDRYFPILDTINNQLLTIEDKIFSPVAGADELQEQDIIQQIHHTKSDLLQLHRAVWPMSDIISMLIRDDTPLITKNTRGFLKDCYDHTIQANELAQFYRDTAAGLLNTYLAYEGHKTNEIVKVLTMVSATFIPLTLIASIYGMNFENPLPGWNGKYGFVFAIFLMLFMAFVMLLMFNRMGWLPTGWPMGKKK